MVTLTQRIERIESRTKIRRLSQVEQRRQAAFSACYQALQTALPGDPPRYRQVTPYVRELIVSRNDVTHDDLRKLIAQRISTGALTDADRQVLEALPSAELEIIGMNAEAFVRLLQDSDDRY